MKLLGLLAPTPGEVESLCKKGGGVRVIILVQGLVGCCFRETRGFFLKARSRNKSPYSCLMVL